MSSKGGGMFAPLTKNWKTSAALASSGLSVLFPDVVSDETAQGALDPLGLGGMGDEEVITPVVPPSTTAAAAATAAEEAAAKARRDFLAKQALLSSRNSTIKTNSLGNASDTLQTGRKTLLGGM